MIKRTSVLICIFVSALWAREEFTRAFDKEIPVHGGERIIVEHKLGDIVIRTHSQPTVSIHADIRVSAGSTDQAKTFADRVEIVIEPSSSQLNIRTRYPENAMSGFGFHNVSFCVRYELVVPESAALEVRNSFGGVTVTGIKASSDIVTSHGDLEFRDGRGSQRLGNSFAAIRIAGNAGDVSVENSNGPVEASDIAGILNVRDRFGGVSISRAQKGVTVVNSNGTVEMSESGGPGSVRNSFGSVIVHNYKGDVSVNDSNGRVEAVNVSGSADLNTTFGAVMFSQIGGRVSVRANNSRIEGDRVGGALTIQNSFGGVTVNNVTQGADIHSSNGGVSLTNVGGPTSVKTSFAMVQASDINGPVTVENSNGGVKIMRAHGAQVTTSFGPVMLDGIAGPLQIENQNGSIDATSAVKGACQPISIRTSFSPLRIRLQPSAGYRVSARTSYAKIRSDFPLTVSGSLSNDELNGSIGNGACEMKLINTNGAIEILKSE